MLPTLHNAVMDLNPFVDEMIPLQSSFPTHLRLSQLYAQAQALPPLVLLLRRGRPLQ